MLIAAVAAAVLGVCVEQAQALSAGSGQAVTDDEVTRSIQMAKEWLLNQGQTGTWPQEEGAYPGGRSDMALLTLAYIGEDPSGKLMTVATAWAVARPSNKTYVRSLRAMALAIIERRLERTGSPKRDAIRAALKADVQWLIRAQGAHGGWNYDPLGGGFGRFDFSNTQMAILALWQAAQVGIEIPDFVWKRSQNLYYALQGRDGAWNYGEPNHREDGDGSPGYGSMTAAGLASVYIIADMLDLASGCPCRDGKSSAVAAEFNRRNDLALDWLSTHFTADRNPGKPNKWPFYWLYSAERAAQATGYKYFGTHNWYREGAELLVSRQSPDGSWQRNVADTCFATLFLYKGRAPILFEKLDCGKGVQWNAHRRDLANLTAFIERAVEQPFQWQIISLAAPLDELHDAPVLYLSLESPPEFTADEKKKLRAFTDTGGTILVEASCGSPEVRAWFSAFAKEVWPQWPLRPLGPDHASFLVPNHLKERPEVMGIGDGLRTIVFYAMDDVSCPWQTRAVASRDYLFLWGINLFTYATDRSPLRARLDTALPPKSEKYASDVKAGERARLGLVRLRYDGGWDVGRQYEGFAGIAAEAEKRAGLTVKVDDAGIAALAAGEGQDILYMTGAGTIDMQAADRAALKRYLAGSGLLWVEAAGGSAAFDQAFRDFAKRMGWDLKPVPRTDPIMTGGFRKAVGYDIGRGVQFRQALRISRADRPWAELEGIWQDGRLVGLYSPLDIVFASTPYQAFGCRGYAREDAAAVALDILLWASDQPLPVASPAVTPTLPPVKLPPPEPLPAALLPSR
jgi:hypothetical protein